jgi:rubrerythrin
MKEGETDSRPPESYPGEVQEYMDSFVKDRVFSGPEQAAEKASQITNPFEAIELAVEFEKRSVGFYEKMKDVVRSSEKEAIDRIISEEKGHMRRLAEFRRELEARSEGRGGSSR